VNFSNTHTFLSAHTYKLCHTAFIRIRNRPVTSLGHQEGRRAFREEAKFFKQCPIVSNYVQLIFPGGQTFFQGRIRPSLCPPGYKPDQV